MPTQANLGRVLKVEVRTLDRATLLAALVPAGGSGSGQPGGPGTGQEGTGSQLCPAGPSVSWTVWMVPRVLPPASHPGEP